MATMELANHPDSATAQAVTDVLKRLRALPRGQRSEIARKAGVAESVLRSMEGADWSSRSIRNLIAVERALAETGQEARP